MRSRPRNLEWEWTMKRHSRCKARQHLDLHSRDAKIFSFAHTCFVNSKGCKHTYNMLQSPMWSWNKLKCAEVQGVYTWKMPLAEFLEMAKKTPLRASYQNSLCINLLDVDFTIEASPGHLFCISATRKVFRTSRSLLTRPLGRLLISCQNTLTDLSYNVVLDPDAPLFILQGHGYHFPLHVPGSYMFLMFQHPATA